MNNKFLDKVCDQIISETRIDNDEVYFPFSTIPTSCFFLPLTSISSPYLFFSHCREIYSLNEQETEYVWTKYKEGITTLMDKKELIHKEKV